MTTRYSRREALATGLRDVRVVDAMHLGIVRCAPDASPQVVARTMAAHRIHAVVVPVDEPEGWGIVSDVELIAAMDARSSATAAELASRPGLYVTPSDDLALVVGLLRQNRFRHLIVVDGVDPVGIISTLDVADVLAELPDEQPAENPQRSSA